MPGASDSRSGYADVNGTRLYFEVAGAGAPVVLVHGFSLDTRMWDEQVPALAERYRVIRYDLRGFGRSAIPEAGVTYRHADDLAGLLDELAERVATVVGLSLGGAVAMDFARVYPDRLRALVLVDSILPGFATPELDADIGRIWGAGRSEGVDAARARWLEVPFFDVIRERPSAWTRLAAMIGDYSGWGWTSRDPGRWVEPQLCDDLGRVGAPTLVVAGERDVPDMQRIADELATRIPDARRVGLPGLGHMPNMEDPAAFNVVLLRFLDETG